MSVQTQLWRREKTVADAKLHPDLIQKPMLAPNQQVPFDSDKIKYPMLASQKFDGYRCLVIPHNPSPDLGEVYTSTLVSRNYKTFANDSELSLWFLEVRMWACQSPNYILDCEIYNPKLTFSELGRIIRKDGREVPEGTKLYVFDLIPVEDWLKGGGEPAYSQRMKLMEILKDKKLPNVEIVEQVECKTPEDAENVFNLYQEMGEEGIMLRSYDGIYKHGRATVNQGLIYKFKVKATADAFIVGFENGTDAKEGLEREVDMLGHRKHLGKVGDRIDADRLGSILVRMADGTETKIGIAKDYQDDEFPDADAIWKNRHDLLGKMVEFTYMPVGVKDKPRWGRLIRIRRDKDGGLEHYSVNPKNGGSTDERCPSDEEVVKTGYSEGWDIIKEVRLVKRKKKSKEKTLDVYMADFKINNKDLIDRIMKEGE